MTDPLLQKLIDFQQQQFENKLKDLLDRETPMSRAISEQIRNLNVGDEVKVTLKDDKTPIFRGKVTDFSFSTGSWLYLSSGVQISVDAITSLEVIKPLPEEPTDAVAVLLTFPDPAKPKQVAHSWRNYYGAQRWSVTGTSGSFKWSELLCMYGPNLTVTVLEPRVEPQWVETQEEYDALPNCSVVAGDGKLSWTKDGWGKWLCSSGSMTYQTMSGRRQVLRVGGGN